MCSNCYEDICVYFKVCACGIYLVWGVGGLLTKPPIINRETDDRQTRQADRHTDRQTDRDLLQRTFFVVVTPQWRCNL